MRLVHAIVGAAVDGGRSLAPWRFAGVHLARSFQCARDLDPKVAECRRTRLPRVVLEKNVVAMRPLRRANFVRRDLAPYCGQLAGLNGL